MGETEELQPITFNGSHGTLRSSVKSIEENGFFIDRSGRLGEGAYFWKECAFWTELAIAWVKQGFSNTYERRIGGIVLFCIINTDESRYLNFEEQIVHDKILEQAKKRRVSYTEKEISKLHDSVIAEMEKRLGCKYEVLEGTVQPPAEKFFTDGNIYPVKVAGFPVCLLVRNKACIKIYNKLQFDI